MEVAKNFSDASKPRAWSKYSKESSAFQEKIKNAQEDSKKVNAKESGVKVMKNVIIKLGLILTFWDHVVNKKIQ